MKRTVFLLATILVLLGGSIPVLADKSDYQLMLDTQSTTTSNGQTTTTTTQSSQVDVTIQNMAFTPATMTVPQGTTVTWTNQDTTAHTVTSIVTGGPNSGTLQPGQSYSYTFNATGKFPYHCSIHPQMTGMVSVSISTPQNPPPSQSVSPPATTQPLSTPSSTSTEGAEQETPSTATTPAPEPLATTTPTAQATTSLPNTGPGDIAAVFIAATFAGASGYYFYLLRRQKHAGV